MDDDFRFAGSADEVQRFRAEALGEPGQRRFRLIVVLGEETYIIWMEKQQMQALGLAIGQILEQVPASGPEIGTSGIPGDIDDTTPNQFRLGRVELGFDESGDSIIVHVFDIQETESDRGLNMQFSRAQAQELIRDAAALAAAGRPMCPMCGQPKDAAGHVCPEQNGHLPLPLDDGMLSED
jgi:uncharacterized repeat protein (TIGR03847 family)